MSISRAWIKENTEKVLSRYKQDDYPTVVQMCKEMQANHSSIIWILKNNLPTAEYAALKKIRYSRSKSGALSPMYKKFGEKHPNWKGGTSDGRGYLVIRYHHKLIPLAHYVIMKELGLKKLPKTWHVHHIDNNPLHNKIDNLAIVTQAGHKQIHYLQAKDSLAVQCKKSTLWDIMKYTTSQSTKTTVT